MSNNTHSMVLTLLGTDRAGLVKGLSNVVTAHQGNWNESRMARLSGKFAGVVHVTLPTAQRDAFKAAVATWQPDDFQVLLEDSDNRPRQVEQLKLELLGHDRPGIVHDISQQLASLKVNIEEMVSEQRTASMSNEPLFFAALTLGLPTGVDADQVQDVLEAMADKLMVDFEFA